MEIYLLKLITIAIGMVALNVMVAMKADAKSGLEKKPWKLSMRKPWNACGR